MQSSSSARTFGQRVGTSRSTICERIIECVRPVLSVDSCMLIVFGQGIYVLQDQAFKPIARISGWEGRAEALKKAKLVSCSPIPSFVILLTAHYAVCRYARRHIARCSYKAWVPSCRGA